MDLARLESLQRRREIAIAQIDAFIDVASAWRGHYEDDEWNADLGWISQVIGETADHDAYGYECGGVLRDGHNQPAMGWGIIDGKWRFGSLAKDYKWPMTRRQFRQLARKNDVSLPSRHAVLFLDEIPGMVRSIVEDISFIRERWSWFKLSFARRKDDNRHRAAAALDLHVIKLVRGGLIKKIERLPRHAR